MHQWWVGENTGILAFHINWFTFRIKKKENSNVIVATLLYSAKPD